MGNLVDKVQDLVQQWCVDDIIVLDMVASFERGECEIGDVQDAIEIECIDDDCIAFVLSSCLSSREVL
jgi:hypothetical protein